jgi:uncharacterized protein (DUF488 family)
MEMVPIHTIGYGSRTIEDLIAVLRQHQIAYLIDVRSKPYSKYKPEFSKQALERRIIQEGLHYVYMGDTLGGQPDLPSTRTADGKIDYAKIREKDFYQRGIQRLKDAWSQQLRVALMCSEGKPEMCHRSKLIGASLVAEGIEVMHIDEQGRLVSQQEVLLRLTDGQPGLFDTSQLDYTSRKNYQLTKDEDQDG